MLNRTLNRFLKEFGMKAEESYDFNYDLDCIVGYTLNSDKTVDAEFLAFCFERGLAWECPIFILSILHEVGHHETEEFLEEDDEVSDNREATNREHFTKLNELWATDWAVDYANNNKEYLEKVWKKLEKDL